VDRDLLLLSGSGMELDINDAPAIRMERRFQHIHFAGEDRVMCRLLAGPTRDFNVMCDRSSTRAEVHARPLIGTMLIFAEPGASWLVHVLGGSCGFPRQRAVTRSGKRRFHPDRVRGASAHCHRGQR
jgi:environmental stress-induced protein Ves